jgi:hypothetical protein
MTPPLRVAKYASRTSWITSPTFIEVAVARARAYGFGR